MIRQEIIDKFKGIIMDWILAKQNNNIDNEYFSNSLEDCLLSMTDEEKEIAYGFYGKKIIIN